MPKGVQTMTDVPPANLQTVVNGFKAQGATVQTKLQTDGNYTVIATFPDGGGGKGGPQTTNP